MDLVKFIPDFNPIMVVSMMGENKENWGQKITNIDKYRDITHSKGENIKVVVLDTGSNKEHPDLAPNFKEEQDFTGENDPGDGIGHSSFVQGIIAGAENGVGIIGIAPKCGLYSGKVLNNSGLCPPDYSWIIKGLQWAIDINADIVNMSLGSPIQPPDELQKLVRIATSKGMILVAASGNEQMKSLDYPGRYDEVISVAAMDKTGHLASYSNIGQNLDFVAPGSDIYSTYLNNGYCTMSGTSMSAPFLSGVTALILSYHRNGEKHDTLVNNYNDVIWHIKKCEKGRIIDIGNGNGIGILDFEDPEDICDVVYPPPIAPIAPIAPVAQSTMTEEQEKTAESVAEEAAITAGIASETAEAAADAATAEIADRASTAAAIASELSAVAAAAAAAASAAKTAAIAAEKAAQAALQAAQGK